MLTEGPEALQLMGDHLTVLIELKKFGHGLTDLKQQLQTEFENAGFPDSSDFLDHALKSGKLLILLDGLDEIPKAVFDTITTQIRDLTDRYPANRFITSCRTAFYKNFLGGFSGIEIASFDDQQIRILVGNWFSEVRDLDSGTAARFDRLLFDRANLATFELARTPLLLTFSLPVLR